MFKRGYDEIEKKIQKSRYLKNCFSCRFYNDEKDECDNNQVLKYDVTVTDGKPCCHKWESG